MRLQRTLLIVSIVLLSWTTSNAQIEFGHLSSKQFSGNAFSGAFNFCVPVSDADYVSAELGLSHFTNKHDNVYLLPILAGYRYTLNRTGVGLYVEPTAGYSFGTTDIQKYDANGGPIYDNESGNYVYVKSSGVTTGANFGYLFDPSEGFVKFQLNICLRYEHTFSELSSNMVSLRITHAFTFGRRRDEW
jgi:hypothetical protein